MNSITRRALGSALIVAATPSILSATGTTNKCSCNCKDGKDGKDGKPGPKGDKGDKGDPGVCECKHEAISIHVDYEPKVLGSFIPVPDIIVSTPSLDGTGLNDELWFYPDFDAAIFFDMKLKQYITFKRGAETLGNQTIKWIRVSSMGYRNYNWVGRNPITGAAHACIVSLDRILSNRNKIIQDWTRIEPTFGSF